MALASFTAYTCGYNFGSTLAGTSVRYRLYSAWGVPPLKILQLLIILALTFWFGMLALGGRGLHRRRRWKCPHLPGSAGKSSLALYQYAAAGRHSPDSRAGLHRPQRCTTSR